MAVWFARAASGNKATAQDQKLAFNCYIYILKRQYLTKDDCRISIRTPPPFVAPLSLMQISIHYSLVYHSFCKLVGGLV